MDKKKNENEKKQKKQKFLAMKIVIFFAALFVFMIIGLILPLRPAESALEKRTLQTFPSFTMASFLDGSYFSDISTWYSDTYPFREKLLAANAGFERIYGVRGQQIVFSGTQTSDAVSDDGTLADALTDSEATEGTDTELIEGELPAASDLAEEAEDEEALAAAEDYADVGIDVEPETAGTVYVTGDTAFDIFSADLNAADMFCSVINSAQERLAGTADIYTIIVPSSSSVNLTQRVLNKLGADDLQEFLDYLYGGMDSSIHTVETLNVLREHNSEYLYFRTDHHWTALGAYYAYTAFCEEKGITPTPIDEYETVEFPDFLGTFYSASNQASALKNNPDTIVAYIPKATNDMTFWNSEYGMVNWNVIYDVSGYQSSEKYNTFAASDQAFSEIDNPDLDDGSSCVIIKDSYGNAFVPFLVDHYDHVYTADFRYFSQYPEYGGNMYDLIADKDVQDVIILLNAEEVIESHVELLRSMFG